MVKLTNELDSEIYTLLSMYRVANDLTYEEIKKRFPECSQKIEY